MGRMGLLALLLSAAVLPAGAADEAADDSTWERLRRLYEQARAAGDDASGSFYEWAREDVGRIGDWQYRIVDLPATSTTRLERKLGKFGESRWEVFWVESRGDRLRFFMKRPARSYLGSVPAGQLKRLLPGGSE